MQTRRFQDFEITDDPIEPVGRTEQKKDDLTLGFKLGYIGNRGAIREIERLIQKYPKDPAFRNYLIAAYSHSGKTKKAIIANNELLKTHPDYLFARTNGVVHLLNEKKPNFAKVRELLKLEGGKVSLKAMNTDRNIFHYSEVAAYYSVVGVYNLKNGDEDGAEKMLEILLDADLSEHPMTLDLANKIMTNRLQESFLFYSEGKENEITVDSFPTVIFEDKENPPTLIHKELEIFYTCELDDLSEAVQQKIMVLPRETLVKDLVAILEDSAHRFEYMQMKYSDDDWEGSETSFAIHSLFFLGALKAEETLPSILNLLRQGDDFIEWWYSDYFSDYYKPTLFALGKNKVADLKAFLLEPNIAYLTKNLIGEVLIQIVFHDESRREEILTVFRDVMSGIAKNENDKTLYDTTFLTILIGSLLDLRAVELLPEIKELYEKKRVVLYIQGAFKELEMEITLPVEASIVDPQPQNIAEFYSRTYEENRAKDVTSSKLFPKPSNPKASEFIDNLLFKSIEDDDEFLNDDDSSFFDEDEYTGYESIETIRRDEPKVSRNAPCPCGSGKKYKKCCWNK